MAEATGNDQRRNARLRLALPVEAQVDGGGFRDVQIVDISPSGLQLWCDDIDDLDAYTGGGEMVEFEVRFRAKRIWCQPMEEDRSFLTGWEIEKSD